MCISQGPKGQSAAGPGTQPVIRPEFGVVLPLLHSCLFLEGPRVTLTERGRALCSRGPRAPR